jgi:hypothetical protein
MVSLNASSSIRGISTRNSLLLSSKQGFVLTSMSHGFSYVSSMKSYPNISKQYFLFVLFIVLRTETIVFSQIGKIDFDTIS